MEDERDARRRLAAEQPVPRDVCPGGLCDLTGRKKDRARGWCLTHHIHRDKILAELLRVTDPHWQVPQAVLDAEDKLLRLGLEAGLLMNRAEAALRERAKAEVALRYLRAEKDVCLECHRAPAGLSNLCRRCEDAFLSGPIYEGGR